MEIADIFRRYTEQVCEIHLYQRVLKTNTLKEYERVIQFGIRQEKIREEHSVPKDIPLSAHNFFFRTARFNQQNHFYGYKERSVEDQKLAVLRHKNKQYQWLLAEAYELFEDFMQSAYAFAAYTDRNFWPLKNYGNISLLELEKQDFDWFVNQANHQTLQDILECFSEKFPQLGRLEAYNKLDINLRLAVILIANLRHVIVHQKGIVSDKGEFIKIMLKKSRLHANKKLLERHIKFIETFFRSDADKSTVYLLEIPIDPKLPWGAHIDIFEDLSNLLMAYALVIVECLEANSGKINSIISTE